MSRSPSGSAIRRTALPLQEPKEYRYSKRVIIIESSSISYAVSKMKVLGFSRFIAEGVKITLHFRFTSCNSCIGAT
jgi:hypothetical protein